MSIRHARVSTKSYRPLSVSACLVCIWILQQQCFRMQWTMQARMCICNTQSS